MSANPMGSPRSCWLLILALLALGACGTPSHPCDKIKCEAGRVCDPATGACLASGDAGMAVGTDGGSDAGP